jgi:hypothetical protein
MRSALPGAAILSLLAGCLTAPAGATSPSRTAAATRLAVERDEAAGLSWLRAHVEEPRFADLYATAVRARIKRIADCTSAACRAEARSARAAAAAFAAGRAARVASLPFATGRFNRAEPGFTGSARILPLTEGRAMLVIALSFQGRPSCDLQGVMAPRAQGGWLVSSLVPDLPDMVVTARGADRLALSYADAAHKPWQVDYCTTGVSIDGMYRRQG